MSAPVGPVVESRWLCCILPEWLFQHVVKPKRHKLRNLFCCLVAKSRPPLWDPIDCSSPGSSVHGIYQVRILEWVAISISRGSFQSGIEPRSPALAGRSFNTEPAEKPKKSLVPPHCLCNEFMLYSLTFETSVQGGPKLPSVYSTIFVKLLLYTRCRA